MAASPWLGLAILLAGLASAPGDKPPAVPVPAPGPVPAPVNLVASINTQRSVFVSDPSFGKDPFYPESKRRLKDLPALPPPSTNKVDGTVIVSEAGFDKFMLKGISRSGDRKLAMINFYTFAEGEEQEVKVDNQTITVKCELIKERSVVIRIKDRTKELMLRNGVY